jgi:tetratricopeptide (TPR) repeat protein
VQRFSIAILVCALCITSAPGPAEAVEIEPKLKTVLRQAWEHHKAGRLEKAFKTLQKAVGMAPSNAEVRYNYGVIALETGRTVLAGQVFEKVVAQAPAHGNAHFNLGLIAMNARKYKKAVYHLSKAATLLPGDTTARHALASGWLALRRYHTARATLMAIKGATSDAGTLALLARVDLAESKWEEAIKHAAAAVKADAGSLVYRLLLVWSLVHAGEGATARRLMAQLKEKKELKDAPDLHYMFALSLFLDGQAAAALTHLQRAMKLAPGHFDVKAKGFNSSDFPTQSDLQFLAWAKRRPKRIKGPRLHIRKLTTTGVYCNAAAVMTGLLKYARRLNRCGKIAKTDYSVTLQVKAGKRHTLVAPDNRGAKCYKSALGRIKLSSKKKNECHATFELTAAK